MTSLRPFVAVLLSVALLSCPQMPGTAALALSAHPTAIDDQGGKTTLRISAADAEGNPGTGSVSLSAAAGVLADSALTLDATGSATSSFSCAVTADPKCMGKVVITGTWNSISETTRVQVGDAGITGSGGGMGGGGGGGALDGGPDAGDAGESDGGTDGGLDAGVDAGFDAGVFDAGIPFAGDAGAVWLLGTLTPNTVRYAFASLDAPDKPVIGLPPDLEPYTPQLRADGRLMYFDQYAVQLRLMTPDAYEHMGSGSAYPALPAINDPTLSIPGCDGGNPVVGFWTRPDSTSFVYSCGDGGQYYEGNRALPALAGQTMIAAGFQGALLAMDSFSDGYVYDDAGQHPLFGFVNNESLATLALPGRSREVRATDGGFFMFRGPNGFEGPGSQCNLYFVANSGAVQFEDIYVEPAMGFVAPLTCTGRLDAAGRLFTLGTVGTDNVVGIRPTVGSTDIASVVYTESGAPPSTFASYPPHVFTFVDSASCLVSGP